MSNDREYPRSSIADGARPPLRDRDADDATSADWQLRPENGAAAHADEDCRLAEALFHAGRQAEAIACCRRALPELADDAAALRICAWVFSNAGCDLEAAEAYRRLLALEPEWGEGWRHLAAALATAGRLEEAIAAALQALAVQPRDDEAAVAAAELLMRAGRNSEAAELLAQAVGDGTTAQLWRVLSAAEMLCGRLQAALAAIDRALERAPENAEYHTHRGHLLWQTGDLAGAAAALDRAARLAPENTEAPRAQLSLLLSAGLVSEATALGGDLLHRFPDDKPAAAAVLHLLAHRLDTLDGEYVTLAAGPERPVRPRRAPSGWPERLRRQRRVIAALIIRETRTRFADLHLGYAWALIEPILHIALLSVMFAMLMRGRPPLGKHFFIFYYTGLIPYLMFVHNGPTPYRTIAESGRLSRLFGCAVIPRSF